MQIGTWPWASYGIALNCKIYTIIWHAIYFTCTLKCVVYMYVYYFGKYGSNQSAVSMLLDHTYNKLVRVIRRRIVLKTTSIYEIN